MTQSNLDAWLRRVEMTLDRVFHVPAEPVIEHIKAFIAIGDVVAGGMRDEMFSNEKTRRPAYGCIAPSLHRG